MLGLASLGLLALQNVGAKSAGVSADRIDLPPVERKFSSATGFSLTIRTRDGWKTPRAWATLENASGAVMWERELPHHLGPRRAFVTSSGQVLLVDEWINVLSRYALTLVAPAGVTMVQYSGEQVISLLAVPRVAITAHARDGLWITEGPGLAAGGKLVEFKAGGRVLALALGDGRLSIRP